MIRSELCLLAGIKPATFNSHRLNGDLPFDIRTKEASAGGGRTWSRFDLYDAMMLIAARNLAQGQGVSWSEAANILRDGAIYLGSGVDGQRASYRLPGFHCARIEFRCEDGSVPSLIRQFQVVRGTLGDIAAYAERVTLRYNERAYFASDRVAVFSVATVNLSQAWHIAVERAKFLEINVHSDGEIEPSDSEG